jgi:hypothetical protein
VAEVEVILEVVQVLEGEELELILVQLVQVVQILVGEQVLQMIIH